MSFEGFIDWLDVVQLVFGMVFVSMCGYVGFRTYKQRDMSFNVLWIPRLLLLVSASLWCFAAIFNNPVIFHPETGLRVTTPSEQGDICLTYHFLNYGLAEPVSLMCAAFLLGARVHSLAEYDPVPLGLAVVRNVGIWCLPNLLFHLVVAILNKAASSTPSFIFLAYSPALRICAIPILTLASAGVFFITFMLLFNVYAHKLSASLISGRLRRRLRLLRLVLTGCFLLGNLSRLIVLFYDIGSFLEFLPSGDAGALTVGALKQVYHFAFLVGLAAAVAVLVHRPVLEAKALPFVAVAGTGGGDGVALGDAVGAAAGSTGVVDVDHSSSSAFDNGTSITHTTVNVGGAGNNGGIGGIGGSAGNGGSDAGLRSRTAPRGTAAARETGQPVEHVQLVEFGDT